ncbi:IS66-like element accessory protein TnpA [Lichenifustis flavocetrariae]|uniref:Transposase n=1 Tax=Lichenifustis flavocetrariae TaxID=2949735 RepID=A0AA41Z1H2_9HYPH|nr:transposase [Lichenifustis flavocetrariae]MCW6511979.1 transposase [Lichenifustis flavocetrariae]
MESGRRRRWSEAEKLRIVVESASGPQLVSATARRHGLSPSQLFGWRRALLVKDQTPAPTANFVPAIVVPDHSGAAMATPSPARSPRIEIVLRGGRRLIVEGAVDTTVTLKLARGLEALR